jgi:hypothetical protein
VKERQKLIRVICKHFAYVNYGVFVSDADAFSNDEGTFLLIKFNKAGMWLYYNEWIEGNFSNHEIDIDDTDLIEIFGEDFSKFRSLALKTGTWEI